MTWACRGKGLGDYEYALTEDGNDPNGVFRLKAVVKEGAQIKMGTFTRIQHVLSGMSCRVAGSTSHGRPGTWLHGMKDEPVARIDKRKGVAEIDKTEFAKKINQIVWDQAPLEKIGVSQERRFDDAFIIYPVKEDHIWENHFGLWLRVLLVPLLICTSCRLLAVAHQVRERPQGSTNLCI